MTAQAFETGCFADVRGVEAARAAGLGAAVFALGAGFTVAAAGADLGAAFAGIADLIKGLGAASGAAETVGASMTASTSIGGGKDATGFAVCVTATRGEVQRDNHHIAMLLEAATK